MTLLTNPTASELRDLLAAKDYEIQQLTAAYLAFQPTWALKDAQAALLWAAAFAVLTDRYQKARQDAQAYLDAIDSGPVPPSLAPANQIWTDVLRSLRPEAPKVVKDDIQDLTNRLVAAGATVDTSQEPQPSSPDIDLEYIKTTDAAAKALQRHATNTLYWGIGGGALLLYLYLSATRRR